MIWSIDLIDKSEMIGIRRDVRDGTHESHCHEFMEIEYVRKGGVIQTINGKKYLGERGDFFLLYKGDVHGYTTTEPSVIVNIIFYPDLYEEIFWRDFWEYDGSKLERFIRPAPEDQLKIETVLELFEDEYAEKGQNHVFVMRQYLRVMLAFLFRAGKRENSAFGKHITEVAAYIDEHIDDVSVSTAAAQIGYSPAYFSRVFKKAFRIAPVEYINRRKIRAAVIRLLRTDEPIDSIALSLNFSNKTHFYKLFRRYTGRTPGEVRAGGVTVLDKESFL